VSARYITTPEAFEALVRERVPDSGRGGAKPKPVVHQVYLAPRGGARRGEPDRPRTREASCSPSTTSIATGNGNSTTCPSQVPTASPAPIAATNSTTPAAESSSTLSRLRPLCIAPAAVVPTGGSSDSPAPDRRRKPPSEETRRKISEGHKRRRAEQCREEDSIGIEIIEPAEVAVAPLPEPTPAPRMATLNFGSMTIKDAPQRLSPAAVARLESKQLHERHLAQREREDAEIAAAAAQPTAPYETKPRARAADIMPINPMRLSAAERPTEPTEDFTPRRGRPPAFITQAKQLLLAGQKLGDVARLCGNHGQIYFRVVFKEHVGMGPETWLKHQRERGTAGAPSAPAETGAA
jgi:hypothetical protein